VSKKHQTGKRMLLIGDAPGGNYLEPALEIAGTLGALRGKGSVSVVNVRHDGWCGIFKGKPCSCRPDFEVSGGSEFET
jgi:hypothetical protein